MFSLKKTMLIPSVLLCLLFSTSLAFSATQADCLEKVLGKGTQEVSIKSEVCEDGFCFIEADKPNGEEFNFVIDFSKSSWEEYETNSGQKIAIEYEVKQFWHDDLNKCSQYNNFISHRVLNKKSLDSGVLKITLSPGNRQGYILNITSKTDALTITQISVNRGNTKIVAFFTPDIGIALPYVKGQKEKLFPTTLKFGNTMWLTIMEYPMEIEVETDQGSGVFTFK